MLFNIKPNFKQLRIYFFLLAFIIGFYHAYFVRNVFDFDGLANLDIGDALFRGQWKEVILSYWGPLYTIILGFFL